MFGIFLRLPLFPTMFMVVHLPCLSDYRLMKKWVTLQSNYNLRRSKVT